ncbi:Molybdopterin or thiamine biosynthesis adenylyltransferase [Jatrophihabitans endophyticus]|uniref:Molybdopterin or thiamine biosynthesis adenylyltransferase n=1 Tax=Jatrophihabitans endophyticus TaxID=1206085 RepID=A0A1M5EPL2_9ACTN|nr:hypothetical protein [Jatrophihabitans endophyticus]SHF81116.1 Molybdopterin or thiamine biosynthesis adenylyltransferase [Jatrophihabitans endophyticus]
MSSTHRDGRPEATDVEYVLSPATRLLWRSPDSLHLELGGRSVVVDGLPAPLVRSLARHPADQAPAGPVPGGAGVSAALAELAGSGFLWRRRPDPTATAIDDPASDAPATNDPASDPFPAGPPLDHRRTPPRPRLAGELLSLATRAGERAAELLDARRCATVSVQGTGRAGPALAALLAAAGVGHVHCSATGSVRLHHALPGGVGPGDEGRSLAAAAHDAILRAAPDADTEPLPVGEHADLTVLAVDEPVADTRRAALHAAGAAHLLVASGVAHAAVGPLVVPGLTSCLRCADLHRRDRDPLWPALAAQLTLAPRRGPTSDAAATTLAVAAAAGQVLTFLDGGEPACLDGSLVVQLPDWRLRRRSRPVHADCDCWH